MDEVAHGDLARMPGRAKARAAVSGYRCGLMDDLYKGWRRCDAPPKLCHSSQKLRREALWTNH